MLYLLALTFVFSVECVYGTSYSRKGRYIYKLPDDIPNNVITVGLSRNNIRQLNQTIISKWYQIERLNLKRNDFSQFPDMCVIGKTLREIELIKNGVRYINNSLLDCLHKIKFIGLSTNKIRRFPNISSVGNTLKILILPKNRISSLPAEAFYNVTALLKLRLNNNPLTQLPDFIYAPSSLQIFHLEQCKIRSIHRNTFLGFTEINFLDISNNKIKNFPNLCHFSNDLVIKTIKLEKNLYPQIISVNTNCLKNLREISIGSSFLTKSNDLNFTNSANSLKRLYITDSKLTSLPYLGPLSSLIILSLKNNNLYYLSKTFFHQWSMIKELYLSGNKHFTVLPVLSDVKSTLEILDLSGCSFKEVDIYSFAILSDLHTLNLSGIDSKFIPTTCLKVNTRMSITVNDLPLCRCQNLWIKQSLLDGNNIILSGQLTCGLNDWRNSSLESIYKSCNLPSLGSLYHFYVKKTQADFLCPYPVIAIQPNQTIYKCASSCIRTSGCYSFNFRPNVNQGRKTGDCMLIVPSKDGIILPNNFQSTGWIYYQFEYHF